MKLIPRAKPIRIRIVSGGEEHSAIESLRKNYSIKDIIPLIVDGRLHKWLMQKGEKEAATIAKTLVGCELDKNSYDICRLTSSIFAVPLSDTTQLCDIFYNCKDKYPRSYKNYSIDFKDFKDIDVALTFYNESSGSVTLNWDTVFVKLLKSMSLDEMLHHFLYKKTDIPIADGCWIEVFKHFTTDAQPDKLFKLGKIASENSFLHFYASRWIEDSARHGCKEAKEWLSKKPVIDIFNEFINSPGDFTELSYKMKKSPIVDFLCVLSQKSVRKVKVYKYEIENAEIFTKYFLLVNSFWELCQRGSVDRFKESLRMMGEKYPNYKFPTQLLRIFENYEDAYGYRLRTISYEDSIVLVAKHVKAELENGK